MPGRRKITLCAKRRDGRVNRTRCTPGLGWAAQEGTTHHRGGEDIMPIPLRGGNMRFPSFFPEACHALAAY